MKPRILIAEDEDSIATSLEFLMRQQGFETRVACDGEVAIECLGEFRPNLVLLDIMLPGRSGFDVCRAIRSAPGLRDTRVLMLTAKGRASEVSKGVEAGADDYIIKPFSTSELVKRVKLLLSGQASASHSATTRDP